MLPPTQADCPEARPGRLSVLFSGMPASRSAPKRTVARLDDRALQEHATRALVRQLGVVGYLRYLRLVAGGRDRYEELRRPLDGLSLDEAVTAIRASDS